MGSRGNCEIVEAKDEPSTTFRTFNQARAHDREPRPPTVQKGPHKSLENDINKLFEAVNLRTAKSLDLSDSTRNASKRPMRAAGSNSTGIGFSAPVSLKQALRGLCISQAAETAALKRLSMPPASPRVSEAGKITNLYRSVVVEATGSGRPPTEGEKCRIKISLVPEESTSCSSGTLPPSHQGSAMKSDAESSCSSPSFSDKPIIESIEHISSESGRQLGECSGHSVGMSFVEGEADTPAEKLPRQLQELKTKISKQSGDSSHRPPVSLVFKDAESSIGHKDVEPVLEVDTRLVKSVLVQEQNSNNAFDDGSNSTLDKKISGSNNETSHPSEGSAISSKVIDKSALKLRRKSRLQTMSSSIAVKSNKDMKSTRSSSRAVKPVVRNKNLVIKKLKKGAVSTGEDVNTSYEVNTGPEHSSAHLICQKCQCSLNDAHKESDKNYPETTKANVFTDSVNYDARISDSVPTSSVNVVTPVVKSSTISKSREKGDISQSSKSSVGDFSSSTTSISDESNTSGSTCNNKPHMSKDTRWGAIHRIRKQYGFLGLSHFNLLKKLGSGDIGTVYLAELIGTNCTFAIKVMDNEFLAIRKKMPRAQAESEILKMLDHPFLPTLYVQFTSDNLSCLVMEFCPGGDLHVLRQKQPGRYFPEEAARFYVAEILLALEYLHMLGIVYRDLKPENILVREDGHIMLTDFDLSLRCSTSPILVKSSSLGIEPARPSGPCAGSNCIDPFCTGPSCKMSCFSPRILPTTARMRKLKDAAAAAKARSLLPQLVAEPTEARSNSFVGTHEYLAPEIIKGEGHGSAVDWWTFGVFLYELLYGKTPFKGAGNDETLENVVLQNLRFPHSPIVSFQARDLIRGLLVKEPENRLGTETGAAEIKRHPFFEGMNWALIRCAVPPQIPELCDVGFSQVDSQEKGKKLMDFGCNGEKLEFELF